MNDKIRQEAMHLHNWCEEQCDCTHCDFGRDNRTCKISGIPAQWFDDDERPVSAKTRQERFLEMFPHAVVLHGVLDVCPERFDGRHECENYDNCRDCKKEYWLEEVEDDGN